MAMPANFGFGEEEQMLRDAARKFFADNLPSDRLHRLVAAPGVADAERWDRGLWEQMAALGWTGIAVPERCGGVGMPAVAAVALAEEAGRAGLPAPLVGTLQASRLLVGCASAAADAAMACRKAWQSVLGLVSGCIWSKVDTKAPTNVSPAPIVLRTGTSKPGPDASSTNFFCCA